MTAGSHRRAEELFQIAADLPAEEHQAFLDEQCGDDTALRAEVEQLLRALEADGDDLLAKPALTVTRPTEPGERPGDRIGPYKLLRQLGEGGMGVVYLAEQEEPIRRRVALKVIKLGMDTKQVIARFEAERQALAMMDHPNVAKVFDAGATEEGRPYFVMEYVPGVPITEYCDTHRLGIQQRLHLFTQVCEAVQHAHQKGIIHRDIKPSNVQVSVEGNQPVPKVIDFGVAKATSQRLTERTLFTEQGQLIGTPEYMSPEQAEMTGLNVDTRTDIYSLGVLLFELLTGALPFDPTTLRQAAIAEIQRIIREEEPPKPSTRLSAFGDESTTNAQKRRADPKSLVRQLQGDLDSITIKALEKDRTRRYATALELAADIERHLNDLPVLASPPSAAYRIRKFAQRNKGLIATAATIVVALLLGTAVSTWQAIRAENARKQALQLADDNKQLADQNQQLAGKERAARLDTERQLRIATAVRLAAQSHSLQKELPVQSLLLAVEAVETTRRYREPLVPIAHESLRSALALVGGQPLSGHQQGIHSVAISADSHWLATRGSPGWPASSAPDETVRLWDLTAQDPTAKSRVLRTGPTLGMAVSPDGHWLATLVYGYAETVPSLPRGIAVRLWDLTAQDPTVKPRLLRTGDNSRMAFSPDGHWLATGGDDETVRLWNLTAQDPGAKPVPLHGHDGAILSMAISADSHWLGTGSVDKTIRIWDLTTGDPETTVRVLRGHEDGVVAVAFSQDGHWMGTGSADGIARLWDLTAQDPTVEPRVLRIGHILHRMAVSLDGHWLATGGQGNTVRLWDLTTQDLGAKPVLLHGHDGAILSMAISADSHWLATGSVDKTVRIWDLTAGDPEATARVLRGHEGTVMAVAFSPDGRWLATGSSLDPIPRLWDMTVEDPAATDIVLRGPAEQIGSMAISPGGRWLVARFGYGESVGVGLWDLTAVDPAATARVLRWPTEMSMSADGHWLTATGSADWYHEVQLWDLTAEDPIGTGRILRDEHNIYAMAISQDGRWLAAGSTGNTARLWDLRVEDPAATSKVLRGHRGGVVSVSFGPDGRWLAIASTDHSVRLWDLTTEDPLDTSAVLHGSRSVLSVAFSPDGRWLFMRSNFGSTLWEIDGEDPVPPPRELRVDEKVHSYGSREAFSPDAHWLVTRTLVRRGALQPLVVVGLWDLSAENPEATGRVLFSGRRVPNITVFSPDRRWLVTEGADGIAQLWDLSAENDIEASARGLRGHFVLAAAFSPDSNWLATAGRDGTTRLWDLSAENQAPTATVLRGHEGSVRFVAISPDGHWLVTGSDDGTVRLRDLRVDALIELAKRRAGRELTKHEVEKYHVPLTIPPTPSLAKDPEVVLATPRPTAPLAKQPPRAPRKLRQPVDGGSSTQQASWDAYIENPHSDRAFGSHMRSIGVNAPRTLSAWYISGVYRAKRKSKEPLWVVQLYDRVDGGFTPGCLVVLGSDGRHLRTIQDERIHWSLVAPKAEVEPFSRAHAAHAKQVVDLPDFNGDSYAEIPTERWKPIVPGTTARARRATSIYLTDDDSIPCVFSIQFYDRWPVEDIPYGSLSLRYESVSDTMLSLETPIYAPSPNGAFALDDSRPHRTLARFTWNPDKRTYVGPMRGPKGLWEVLDRR